MSKKIKTIKKIAGNIILVLLIGSAVSIAYNAYVSHLDNIEAQRLVVQTELCGFSLKADIKEVRFRKGAEHKKTQIDSRTQELVYYSDDYRNYEISITVVDGLISEIYDSGYNCRRIFGFSRATTYEEVIERLGQPTKIHKSEDGTYRLLFYDNYQVIFFFAKARIIKQAIYTP
jgi:hypothetical protein